MAKDLFAKTLYTNKGINYLKGTIREYDMKEAGFSIIKNDKLLPQETIDRLSKLAKMDRTIEIGKIMGRDKEFNKALTQGFGKYREMFIKENSIDDASILAIKKDALFIINKAVRRDTFGHVHFALKNRYTSYMYINKTEYYFNSMRKTVDIKGINDEKLKKHRKYIIKFIIDMMYAIELGDKYHNITRLKKFANKYRNYELPIGYYREFNDISRYIIKDIEVANSRYAIDHTGDLSIEDLDISYNYMNVIVTIAKIVYK